MLNLECPNCQCTPLVSTWNENVKDSIALGICRQLIPEDITPHQWDVYEEKEYGSVDCPECGERVPFCDMMGL